MSLIRHRLSGTILHLVRRTGVTDRECTQMSYYNRKIIINPVQKLENQMIFDEESVCFVDNCRQIWTNPFRVYTLHYAT